MSLLSQTMEKVAALECRLSQLEAENAKIRQENISLSNDLASSEVRESSLRQALADAESKAAAAERAKAAATSMAESLSTDRGRIIDRLAELEQLRTVSRRQAALEKIGDLSGEKTSSIDRTKSPSDEGTNDLFQEEEDGLDLGSFIAEMRGEIIRLSEENRDLQTLIHTLRSTSSKSSNQLKSQENSFQKPPSNSPSSIDISENSGSTTSKEQSSEISPKLSFGRTPYTSVEDMADELSTKGRYRPEPAEQQALAQAENFDTPGERAAFERALADLSSPSLSLRKKAASALGFTASLAALPTLTEALSRESDEEVATTLANSVASIGKQSAVPLLIACLAPPTPLFARLAALEALMSLGNTWALVRAVCDPSPLVRRRALVLAAGFQPNSSPADGSEPDQSASDMDRKNLQRVLERGAADTDDSVRKVARLAGAISPVATTSNSTAVPSTNSAFDNDASNTPSALGRATEKKAFFDAENDLSNRSDLPLIEGDAMADLMSAPGLSISLKLTDAVRHLERTISKISGIPRSDFLADFSPQKSSESREFSRRIDGSKNKKKSVISKSYQSPSQSTSKVVSPSNNREEILSDKATKSPSDQDFKDTTIPTNDATLTTEAANDEAVTLVPQAISFAPISLASSPQKSSKFSPQKQIESSSISPSLRPRIPPSGQQGRSQEKRKPQEAGSSPLADGVREEVARAIVSRVYGSLKGLTLEELLHLVRADSSEIRQGVEILVRHRRIIRRGQRYFVP